MGGGVGVADVVDAIDEAGAGEQPGDVVRFVLGVGAAGEVGGEGGGAFVLEEAFVAAAAVEGDGGGAFGSGGVFA
ncbi:MAG: hypothetical protein IPM07_19220 [Anaerolineales bacterium]|nr:hypothetical protein [Anaerolineales bacterium]